MMKVNIRAQKARIQRVMRALRACQWRRSEIEEDIDDEDRMSFDFPRY